MKVLSPLPYIPFPSSPLFFVILSELFDSFVLDSVDIVVVDVVVVVDDDVVVVVDAVVNRNSSVP